ncbi:MAG: FKBP-type peptidyl-prolyl cis-trans isomerase [Desulfobacterales bacterium]
MLFICNCESFAKNENAKAPEKSEKAVVLEENKDKVSYVIGNNIARSLKNVKDEIDLEIVIHGIKDQFNGKPLQLSEEDAASIMREFSMKIKAEQEEQAKLLASQNLEKGKNFLETNSKAEGVVTTESGLQYLIIENGDGPKPVKTDMVKVHYTGTTIEGEEFDSSYKRGEPAVFPVTGVIKGWTEALLLMNVGSKYKLFIPSELAYGERGAGPTIAPNAVLLFEVELLEIEKKS